MVKMVVLLHPVVFMLDFAWTPPTNGAHASITVVVVFAERPRSLEKREMFAVLVMLTSSPEVLPMNSVN